MTRAGRWLVPLAAVPVLGLLAYGFTLNPRDVGHFKSPSLRNVEVAGPYMHDGRFETLEAVIDHYSSGGKKHPNRDVRIQPLNFTASEKAALIAFLQTLTDRKFLEDPQFSDPLE